MRMCGVAMPHDIYCSYIILDSYMRNRYNSRCDNLIMRTSTRSRGVGRRARERVLALPALVALGALASKVA